MRNFIVYMAVAMVFITGTPPGGQAMTIAVPAGMGAVLQQTTLLSNVSFYYGRSPHVYGPYYDYAYRPFWKYRIPSVYYRCGC